MHHSTHRLTAAQVTPVPGAAAAVAADLAKVVLAAPAIAEAVMPLEAWVVPVAQVGKAAMAVVAHLVYMYGAVQALSRTAQLLQVQVVPVVLEQREVPVQAARAVAEVNAVVVAMVVAAVPEPVVVVVDKVAQASRVQMVLARPLFR